MIKFIYNLGIHLFILYRLPKVIYEMIRYGKYRKSFMARFGIGFPKICKEGKSLVWIHAVSLGETKAIAPLVKRLKSLAKPPQVLLSTSTETGHKEGKNSSPEADYHCFLPLDFPYLIAPIMKKVKPDLLLLTESDFWLNFQNAAKKEGAKLILINGKVSERSFRRLKKISFFTKRLFEPFFQLCVQGSLYQKRFLELGVDPEKIEISGNIKLDKETPQTLFSRKDLGLTDDHLILTLGSTHHPEEELFLEEFKSLEKTYPNLRLIIVPRHPERFCVVEKILLKQGIAYTLYSKKLGFDSSKVLLVDKMGVLMSFYALSDLAFVGGSFVKSVGGHNILEPCVFGVCVLFGPHMHSQPDFLDLMNSYEAGFQVTKKTLRQTLDHLLSNPEERKKRGDRGKILKMENQGAIENIWKCVSSCLKSEERSSISSLSRDGAVVSSLGS